MSLCYASPNYINAKCKRTEKELGPKFAKIKILWWGHVCVTDLRGIFLHFPSLLTFLVYHSLNNQVFNSELLCRMLEGKARGIKHSGSKQGSMNLKTMFKSQLHHFEQVL